MIVIITVAYCREIQSRLSINLIYGMSNESNTGKYCCKSLEKFYNISVIKNLSPVFVFKLTLFEDFFHKTTLSYNLAKRSENKVHFWGCFFHKQISLTYKSPRRSENEVTLRMYLFP